MFSFTAFASTITAVKGFLGYFAISSLHKSLLNSSSIKRAKENTSRILLNCTGILLHWSRGRLRIRAVLWLRLMMFHKKQPLSFMLQCIMSLEQNHRTRTAVVSGPLGKCNIRSAFVWSDNAENILCCVRRKDENWKQTISNFSVLAKVRE